MIDYFIPQTEPEPKPTVTNSLLNYLGLGSENTSNQVINSNQPLSINNILNNLRTRQETQVPYTIPNQQPRVDYSQGNKPDYSGSALTQATNMIKNHEGFQSGTYWDVNAYRLGYGTDTITNRDGSVRRVKKGDTVTREQAELDLQRRTRDFMSGVAKTIGQEAFNRLPANVQASLTSVAYNYGSLNKLPSVIKAARSGNTQQIAAAVNNLGSHNKGVNRRRRQEEANYILGRR